MVGTEFAATLMRRLEEGVAVLVKEGGPVLTSDPEAVAERMLAAVPRAHVYDELVGPFYSAEGLRKMLDVSRQAIHDRVQRGTLLQVRTKDGLSLYPAFQFRDGEVPQQMREVIAAFREAPVDGWAVATWLSVPAEALDGRTPRQWLSDPEADPRAVHVLATQTATRWAAP